MDGGHPFIFRRYPGTVLLVSLAAQATREPHPMSLAVARAMYRYHSHELLNLPKVIDARKANQEWVDMVTALTMRGTPPLSHWLRGTPPLPHWLTPPRPQQTIKEAFFDPEPGCDPDPEASSSADRVNPFEEE